VLELGESAKLTRAVGSADLAAGGGESAKPIGPGLCWSRLGRLVESA
jgi:hypothetical protein